MKPVDDPDTVMRKALADTFLRLFAAAHRAVDDPTKTPFQHAFAAGVIEAEPRGLEAVLEILPADERPN